MFKYLIVTLIFFAALAFILVSCGKNESSTFSLDFTPNVEYKQVANQYYIILTDDTINAWFTNNKTNKIVSFCGLAGGAQGRNVYYMVIYEKIAQRTYSEHEKIE
jgi:hypothetical protein